MLFFLHFFSSMSGSGSHAHPQPSFLIRRLFSSEKTLFLMKHDLIPLKQVLIFVTFLLLPGQSAIPVDIMSVVCKLIHFMLIKLKKLKRKIRKFQDSECVEFQLDDENDHHPYSRMLEFEQMNDEFGNKITRTFLCKQIIKNDTTSIWLFQRICVVMIIKVNTSIFTFVMPQSC